jgi:plastocyanin
LAALFSAVMPCRSQTVDVTGTVILVKKTGGPAASDNSNAVVSLRPVDVTVRPPAPGKFEIRQKHKRFEPPFIAIPVGSVVAFPNLDPFFHNVFSLYDGKRFDLGLYEAGASRSVTFDHAGVCYVFCNIHPEMAAAVIVLDTPYYAVTGRTGEFRIASVPPGRYLLSVWHQHGRPAKDDVFPRQITVGPDNAALPTVQLIDSGELVVPHTNKYGRSYDSTASQPGPYR